jgi:aspartyl-tRNA(Asn)/glutamyl-tRNA(Gln) amidotransferase subunit B
VEIKNLNSFRAIERSIAYEVQRQIECLRQGHLVRQETVGWDVVREETYTQRVKEGEDDYRYFPEPDLPPLVVEPEWIEQIRLSLPELPAARYRRFRQQYGLNDYDADVLVAEQAVADYYERAVAAAPQASSKAIANWVSGELFGLLNEAGVDIEEAPVPPEQLAALVEMVGRGEINQTTAKGVLSEMFSTGRTAREIVAERGLAQITDADSIARLVSRVLAENPQQVAEYLGGKPAMLRWFFGQVMRAGGGKASPQVVQQELERQFAAYGKDHAAE